MEEGGYGWRGVVAGGGVEMGTLAGERVHGASAADDARTIWDARFDSPGPPGLTGQQSMRLRSFGEDIPHATHVLLFGIWHQSARCRPRL
jgi:hypothetical protein